MVYAERDIHGRGECSPAVLRAAIVDRGRKLAAFYAPDRQYHEPPAGIEDSIIAECRRFPGFEVDPDGVTVQINEETAGLQSAFWLERNNPGGIGAIDNDPGQAIYFKTPAAGIRAHVAKLRNYRFGEGPWSSEDPRAPAIRANNWMGSCRSFADLQGKWATSQTYRQSLESIWTRMSVIRQEMGEPVWIDIRGYVPPRVVQQWFAPNGVSYMGEPMEMWGVCVHETGNTDPGSEAQQNVDYMNGGAISRQASWHATVGQDIIIETIPDDRQAYHASDGPGPGNTHFLAVEGVMCYPAGTPEFRRVMLNHAWYTALKLHQHGLGVTPIVQDADWSPGVTLAQHNSFARDNKDCPSFYRDNGLWGTFSAYVNAFHAERSQGVIPEALFFSETGYAVSGGFLRFWEAKGGLAIFGFPITPERVEDGMTVQYFERARFEWHPGSSPENWDVMLGLLGVESLATRAALVG